MRAAALLLTGLLPSCQLVFSLDSIAIDAPHLQPEARFIGELPVELEDGTVIDTGELMAGDVVLDSVIHAEQSFDLAVLRGSTVTFRGTVRVQGSRGLVVLARTIIVDGLLDAGARTNTPGPSGGLPDREGAGGNGGAEGVNGHMGGGGGGHATVGGEGGGGGVACMATGGTGGVAFGDVELTILAGGGAGGVGKSAGAASCTTGQGGGGGGAIQLSALESIEIYPSALISVNGGGGLGGVLCPGPSGGAGGGAGGAIYLDAPLVGVEGALFANGGGGGGGGGTMGVLLPGEPGADGQLGVLVAEGGISYGQGTDGGAGGVLDIDPIGGQKGCEGEGGGGGGAVGRIVYRGTLTANGVTSPMPVAIER